MYASSQLPDITAIVAGGARFSDSMPVWLGTFGAPIWPLIEPSSPLYQGETSSSLMWNDYRLGRGTTNKNPSSFSKSTYKYCLTQEIVDDLKTAAVIYGYFPKLIKDARSSKGKLDPKTVKGRIDELAKFFSMVIEAGRERLGFSICRLDQIPFSLIKEVIPTYPGRSEHLKRALKLISDPMIQKNLNASLQWEFLDISKSSIAWQRTPFAGGIPTLSDMQFLFLLNHCKRAITTFKHVAGLAIHDSECKALPELDFGVELPILHSGLQSFYSGSQETVDAENSILGSGRTLILSLIRDAHLSAMMLILIFTGIRVSETHCMLTNCLIQEHGFWFLKSKVVKGRPKDAPISEGWLAIDIAKDAYDILNYIGLRTANPNLFSSALPRFAKNARGFRGPSLNTKFSRWLKQIDNEGLFAGYQFSVHQCRETLVFQLAKQEVGLPFISMQLKHFQSQFNNMPNAVTAGYGQYRSQLMERVSTRMAEARESALTEVYGENAKFAGGGGDAHKARIDTFFSGVGLFGVARERYIRDMARRGVKLMPTSIGSCTKNFIVTTENAPPPCYGDFQCDPECGSHVITKRGGLALKARKEHALTEAEKEPNQDHKNIWLGLAKSLSGHLTRLGFEDSSV
jgi:hypothetical protein